MAKKTLTINGKEYGSTGKYSWTKKKVEERLKKARKINPNYAFTSKKLKTSIKKKVGYLILARKLKK